MLVISYQCSLLYESYKMRCRATGVKIYGRWARKGHKESIFIMLCPIRDSWSWCYFNHNYFVIINLCVIKLLIVLCIYIITIFRYLNVKRVIWSLLYYYETYQRKNYNNIIYASIPDCLTGQTVIKILYILLPCSKKKTMQTNFFERVW